MGYQILFGQAGHCILVLIRQDAWPTCRPKNIFQKVSCQMPRMRAAFSYMIFRARQGQDQNPCRLQARPSARQRDGRWQNHLVGDHLVHGFHIKIDHGRTLVFRNIHVNIRITQAGVNCFHDKRIAAVAHDDDKFREIPGHLVCVAGSAYSIIAPGTCGGGAMVMKTGQFSSQHLE